MGAETSAVIALIFVGFLTIGTTTYASYEYSNSLVKNSQYEKDIIKKARMQTDITIMNITNTTTQLNLTVKNTGKTTLNASAMNVFINGNLSNYTVVMTGNVWVPQNSTNITIPVNISIGDRIKITAENGVSDYRLKEN
jgi:archaellum component FlaF (FlaF/FlaG flagellin family)